MGKKLLTKLTQKIEPESGGVFFLKPPDRAITRFMTLSVNITQERKRRKHAEIIAAEGADRPLTAEEAAPLEALGMDDADIPAEFFECAVDIFMEGVIHWQDVEFEDEDYDTGEPRIIKDPPCNAETKGRIETMVKITVGFEYMQQWQASQLLGIGPDVPATGSTPPSGE